MSNNQISFPFRLFSFPIQVPEQYRFQPDLPAHLQQLRQAQEIQNFNNFFRAERENVAVPLSQQGLPYKIFRH